MRLLTIGLLALLSATPVLAQADDDARQCSELLGSVLVTNGEVSVKAENAVAWIPLAVNDPLCAGDIVRSLANSSASLLLDAEQTIVRLKQHASFALPTAQSEGFWVELYQGTLNFLSRTSRSLSVRTPFVNATVEGTEFQVMVDTQQAETLVTVLDGQVRVANSLGALSLQAGQAAQTREGQPPELRLDIKPENAVQWSLYFPVLMIDGTEPGADWYQRAQAILQDGQLDAAVAALNKAPVDSAADAMALQAVIRIKQNRLPEAQQLVDRALQTNAQSPNALLALSYVEQAAFDLQAAIDAIELLRTRQPDNAQALTRLMELELARGNTRKARALADQYQTDLQQVGRFHTTAGFAALLSGDLPAAITAFDTAAALDPADPLNQLGLGLSAIRQGQLAEGRQALETAVSLEPTNALLRSYLAKAYFAEQRAEEAAEQLTIASRLDTNDPTPWLYQAVMLQAEGRPYDALAALNRSSELNDNRAVYRSRLLLDQDSAIKSVNRARVYRELGLDQQALNAAVDSLVQDPTNASAHQFLSETYAGQRDTDIARVSELLQSQLLTRRFSRPVLPSAGEADLLVSDISDSSEGGLNEYSQMFEQDGVMASLSATAGSFNTFSDEVAVAYQGKQGFISAGRYRYRSDELVPDQPVDYDIVNLLGKWFVTPELSLMAEVRRKDTKRGDVAQRFDYGATFSEFDLESDEEQALVGFHYQATDRLDILGIASILKEDFVEEASTLIIPLDTSTNTNADIAASGKYEVGAFELQGIYRLDKLSMKLGYVASEYDYAGDIAIVQNFYLAFPPFPQIGSVPLPPGTEKLSQKSQSLYFYSEYYPLENITVSLGLDIDDVDGDDFTSDGINPKLGFILKPTKAWRLRGLVSRSVKRPLISGRTLAPTQIAGFNLVDDDYIGTEVKLYGFGLDYSPSQFGNLGVEYYFKDFDSPRSNDGLYLNREHNKFKLFGSLAVNSSLSLDVSIESEKLARDADSDISLPIAISNRKLPIRILYRSSPSLLWEFKTTWVDHESQFPNLPGANAGGSDQFSISDLRMKYRALKHLQVSAGVLNVFDEAFQYQNTDFDFTEEKAPEFAEERTYYLSVSVPL